jgi:hypothetical protein
MTSFLRTYADDAEALQQPMDVAVVIPTVLRPSLVQAVQSVFAQEFEGRVQILVGVDRPEGAVDLLDQACANRPSNCFVQAVYPGYSTAACNGGLALAADGGALRCVLTLLANSQYVAYLDDDNWWGPAHLASMRSALAGAQWAFALRWFVHPDTERPVAVDRWESVGPGQGVFGPRLGGFVDPSCLMIDKMACPDAVLAWNFPLMSDDAKSADRRVFQLLNSRYRGAGTGAATVHYRMSPADEMHQYRLGWLGNAYEAAGEARSSSSAARRRRASPSAR